MNSKPSSATSQINWLDRIALRDLAWDALVVFDIGTFCGDSAETMLEVMPEKGVLYTVDTFCGTPGGMTENYEGSLEKAQARLKRFAGRVHIIRGTSLDVAKAVRPGTVDLVFLDAAHTYESVMADIRAWLPALNEKGTMAGHDFDKTAVFEPSAWLVQFKDKEKDPDTNMHLGVVEAVRASFSYINVFSGRLCTVWSAKSEWAIR